MRSYEIIKKISKLGAKECMEHNLLVPYPVLTEKSGEVVAQFKYTVAILQGQTVILSGLSLDETKVVSEHKITEQKILDLLAVNLFI